MKMRIHSLVNFMFLSILSLTAIFSNSINAQEDFTVRPVGHFGGYPTCSAVVGENLFLVQGTVLSVLKMNGGEFQKITSLTLPDEPAECYAVDNYLYLFEFNWNLDATFLRIIDISNAQNPFLTSTLQLQENPDWFQGKILAQNSHVFLALDTEFKIVDVTNPQSPEIVSTVSTSAKGIFARDNYVYVGGENNFKVYDITDKQNPVKIGSCSITSAKSVFVQGNKAYVAVAKYPNYGMRIIDIENAQNPEKLGFFETKKVEGSHTTFYNPNYVAAEGDYAYVGCWGSALLIIADVSDPLNPQQTGKLNFDEGAFPDFQSFQLEFPYIYAATGATSIQFIGINISDPENPEIEIRFEEPWDAQSMATSGDTLYVASFERLWVYDYSDTSNPVLLGSDTTWAELLKMQVRQDYLYGTTENEFHILDIADPNNIFEVGNYISSNQRIIELVVYDNSAYLLTVSENQSLLEIINITDPNSPTKEAAEYAIPGNGRDFCLLPDGMFALIAYRVDESNQGFQIIDISDLPNLIVLGTTQTAGNPISIGVADTLVLVGSNSADNWYLEAYNIIDPENPVNMGSTNGGGFSHKSTTNSNFPYVDRNLAKLNKSEEALESFDTNEYPNPQSKNLISIPYIADFVIVPRKSTDLENRILIAVSVPGGSLHFYFLEPGAGTVEWIIKAICESPASTVVAAIVHPLFATFFSIDGWMDLDTKQVSGSWGIFVQRLLLEAYLAALQILPNDATVEKGDKVQFTATGTDNFGENMDVTVTWSATGGEINSETGEYTATELGEHIITAVNTITGISSSVTIVVNIAKTVSIEIIPPEATIAFGDTLNFTGKGVDKNGNETETKFVWISTGDGIDSANGGYIALEVGDFTVTGTDTLSGKSGTATVHVTSTNVKKQTYHPTNFTLFQNYPNPFNPTTTIEFSVKEKCFVVLEIFDIRGRVIKSFINQEQQPGMYRIIFDAYNLPSGVYFYRIKMKDFMDIKKMVVLE
jgi:hypothetical protein